MSISVGGATRVLGNRRFYDDSRRLPPQIAKKLAGVVEEIHRFGPRHEPLHTRRIEGNPDGRFHFMNVDNKWRIVAVLDGTHVFLERVGNHDEVLAWGPKATMKEYQQRLEVRPEQLHRAKAPAAPPGTVLFEFGLSLPEIADQQSELSDVLIDDPWKSLEGYRDGLIEDWMIFLSPLQRRAVDRAVNGPSRITGGPGTGKTVVGLHRALAFARAAGPGQRVLVTSFINSVPEVLEGLFERLAPDLAQRVEFRSIHSLAGTVIARSGLEVRVDDPAAKSRFIDKLNGDLSRRRALQHAGFSDEYLWDEVTRVIEGREIESLEQYRVLRRHGRERRMEDPERRLVWALYEEYRSACDRLDPPVMSWTRHLTAARRAAADDSEYGKYTAIVVDEAQDITQAGIRLLLQLLEGGTTGQIVLIGDGGQRIYAGGFRLTDLDLEVRGRSFVLTECYRSTGEIMRAAASLGRFLSSEEFGEDAPRGAQYRTLRSGPPPTLREFADTASEQAGVIASLREAAPDPDGTAILVSTNRLADIWTSTLKAAGFDVCKVRDYHGRPVPGVKVGTYDRAKGLEFKRVILPNLSAYGLRADNNDPDNLIVRGTRLYVAMTRTRDRLELSYAGEPSLFVEPLLEHCDVQ